MTPTLGLIIATGTGLTLGSLIGRHAGKPVTGAIGGGIAGALAGLTVIGIGAIAGVGKGLSGSAGIADDVLKASAASGLLVPLILAKKDQQQHQQQNQGAPARPTM